MADEEYVKDELQVMLLGAIDLVRRELRSLADSGIGGAIP